MTDRPKPYHRHRISVFSMLAVRIARAANRHSHAKRPAATPDDQIPRTAEEPDNAETQTDNP
jgi:hypothetical protein